MTTPLQPTQSDTLIDLLEFAARNDVNPRTVRKWQERGELPAAQKIDGKWWLPADAKRERVPGSDVAPTRLEAQLRAALEALPAPAPAPAPLGTLYTLHDAAEMLGTSTGGIRRMIDAGLLVGGPYGRAGALAVYMPAGPA